MRVLAARQIIYSVVTDLALQNELSIKGQIYRVTWNSQVAREVNIETILDSQMVAQ